MTKRHWTGSWAAAISAVLLATTSLLAQGPESIGVHGAWVIDVRNPDGSLAAHREFENALVPSGGAALVRILSGTNAFGPMSIALDGAAHPCSSVVAGGLGTISIPCIFTPVSVFQVRPSPALVLTGTVTASANGAIDRVQTLSRTTCGLAVNPCGPLDPQVTFTEFSFAGSPITPIQVVAGQVIQVTVTLSFS